MTKWFIGKGVLLEKKKCERCGTEYRVRTVSENKGKHICSRCINHCSVCGKSLPMSNRFGETASVTGAILGPAAGSLRDSRRPHIGSGMCNECFYKQKELQQAQVAKPSIPQSSQTQVFCRYCGAKNEADAVFCKSCGKNIK